LNPLIIIIGPTAVGKSSLGVELALNMGGEIISGDSVQVYRKLNIGSAKPSAPEQKGVVHHLIDILDPREPFTAADFQSLTRDLIHSIHSRGKVPILVGGTGLYIRSLLDGYNFPEEGSEIIKNKWLSFLKTFGNQHLYLRLLECDPVSAERLHPNDTSRIIRALEVFELTGKPLSVQRSYREKEYPELDDDVVYIGLNAPRELIYSRIDQRCNDMVKYGIIEEVITLLREGYSPRIKSLQSIGYRHVIYYLRGMVTMEEMMRLFKRDTRRFAKRQLTWFNRDPRIKWYDITTYSVSQIINEVTDTICKTCRV